MTRFRPRHAALAVALVALAPAARAADLERTNVFPPQDKHVHASSIVEAPDGGLVAVWFHGSGERSANDVVVQGARRAPGAAEWGPVFVAADTAGVPDCNPVLHVDARGRLVLFWVVVRANGWEHSILKYRVAEEWSGEGSPKWTWQDIALLDPGDDFPERLSKGLRLAGFRQDMWGEYAHPYDRLLVEAAKDPVRRGVGWMTRARPIVLATAPAAGRTLLPLYSDGYNVSLVAISDDDGESWRPSAPLIGLGNIQPTLAERRDGSIVALMRDSGGAPSRVMQSVSTDGGANWTIAKDTDLPNPGSSLALADLRDGRWALVLNDTEHGRHRISAYLSADEGRTWTRRRVLDESEPGEGGYGYPTAIVARDGAIHATYTRQTDAGKTIAHVRFPPEWIEEGEPVPAPGDPPAAFVNGEGPGWVPLGEADFVNVNCAPDTWTWDGDRTHCTGNPVGVIRSAKTYRNFELVARWRHLQAGGNSGIFLWATEKSFADLPPGKLPRGGIEVQVLDHGYSEQYEKQTGKKGDWFTTNGDVFPVGDSAMKPFPPLSPDGSRSFPRKNLSRGTPEWNHYYVRAIEGEVRLWVNGEEVSGGSDAEPREGYLCLESEGAPVEFEGIRIRELP